MTRIIQIPLLVLLVNALHVHGQCAELKLIKECFCLPLSTASAEVEVKCRGLTQSSQIKSALDAVPNCVSFKIEDSRIPSLPLDLGHHNLKNLSIINTRMPYISPPMDSRSALDKLSSLIRIKLENVDDVTDWDWNKLRNLVSLKVFFVQSGSLVHIPKEFSGVGGSNLEELSFQGCGLASIATGGLAFPNLKMLQITDDPLEELRADMFHEDSQVERLILFGLSVQYVPLDVFQSLKKLKSLATDSDFFLKLSEGHLSHVILEEFAIFPGKTLPSCDCKHKWLLRHNAQYIGSCAQESQEEQDFGEFLQTCVEK